MHTQNAFFPRPSDEGTKLHQHIASVNRRDKLDQLKRTIGQIGLLCCVQIEMMMIMTVTLGKSRCSLTMVVLTLHVGTAAGLRGGPSGCSIRRRRLTRQVP